MKFLVVLNRQLFRKEGVKSLPNLKYYLWWRVKTCKLAQA